MSNPATATINLGGTAVGGNPSGLAITGSTTGFQAVTYTNGTVAASPTGYTATTSGHQTALFTPGLVGANPSGLSNSGPIATLGAPVGGSLYTNGTYTDVNLTGGEGTGAQATIVVAGNVVTTVTLTSYGTGYLIGDVLTSSNAYLGHTGSGFSVTVTAITPMMYSTSINIDGTPHTVTMSGPSAQTVTAVLAAINTAITGFGTAAIDGNGNLTVTSATTGPSSTVIMVTGTLFPYLTGFQYISASVPGKTSPSSVTADVYIDGVDYPVSLLTTSLTTFADVITGVQTAIGGAGTVAMGVSSDDVVLSAATFTGGSGYVNGVYNGGNNAGVPLHYVLPVTAGSFIVGETYTIISLGTTDFTLIGAASNTADTTFVATGVGSGTGTANPTYPGSNAFARITVAGGMVTGVQLVSREGTGFRSGDVLTALASDLGGSGSGFTVTLMVVTSPGPDFTIKSATTGDSSTVLIVDGVGTGLFETLAGFVQFEPPHKGVTKARTYSTVVNSGSTIVSGEVNALGDIIGGSGYVNGTYYNVPLTGGSGTGAQAKIVVSGVTFGTATVALTATPAVTPSTLLGIAAGPYTFTANVNGLGATTYTVNSSGVDTMASMASLMTTALAGNGYVVGPGARVTAVGNAFVITSPSLGAASTVIVTIPAASGTDLVGAINTSLTATNTNVSVAGINAVTSVVPTASGMGYVGVTVGETGSTGSPSTPITPAAGDVLSASNASLGGSGSGFTIPVISTIESPFLITILDTGIVDNTFTAVINGLNTSLGLVATASITGGNIVITTTATGPTATIGIADTGFLFSSLHGYLGIVYSGTSPTAEFPPAYGVGS